jgi:hypothetical protein
MAIFNSYVSLREGNPTEHAMLLLRHDETLKPNSPHSDALPTQVGLHPDDVTYLEAMVDVEDWNGSTNEGSMLLFNLDRTYIYCDILSDLEYHI